MDALNEGLNVPDVDSAICLSGSSTAIVTVQSLGRILRQKEGKKAIFINLYTKYTVEEKWITKKLLTTGLDKFSKWVSDVKQITW